MLSAVGFVMKPNVVLDKCAKAIRHVCPGLSGQTCMECFERWAMELQLANACDLQPNSKGGLPKTMLSIMQGCGSGFLFDMHTGESRARSLHEPSAVFERLFWMLKIMQMPSPPSPSCYVLMCLLDGAGSCC